jgi:predicted DNA-binding transcriptional regulator YafY
MGMAKYDRLLYILNLLRSRRSLNAARLAEECEVTERSIYRDIISLSEANVPIFYDNGYKLASDNFLPPLNFTFEEYACLKLALESSPLGKTGTSAAVLKQVQAKVEAGLSRITKEKKRTARNTAHIDIDTTLAQEKAEKFYAAIESAASSQSCLEIDYETIDHGLTHRMVEPYFIIFRGRAFYFVAFCRLRQEFRTFRIDRVCGLRTTSERFRRQKDINPRDYFGDSWRLYSGEPVEIVVRFSGSAARVVKAGSHHPKEEIVDENDGTVLYRVVVSGIEEIQRWILGFGDEAEVVAPKALRDNLKRVGRYFDRTYRGNDRR